VEGKRGGIRKKRRVWRGGERAKDKREGKKRSKERRRGGETVKDGRR